MPSISYRYILPPNHSYPFYRPHITMTKALLEKTANFVTTTTTMTAAATTTTTTTTTTFGFCNLHCILFQLLQVQLSPKMGNLWTAGSGSNFTSCMMSFLSPIKKKRLLSIELAIWLTFFIFSFTVHHPVGSKHQEQEELTSNRYKCCSFSSQNKCLPLAVELSASLPVPVRQCHHDVQWCQEEDEVKETVAVSDSISLIISHVLSRVLHISICSYTQCSHTKWWRQFGLEVMCWSRSTKLLYDNNNNYVGPS